MTPATATKSITAEEYAAMPDDGRRTELVKGVVVEMPLPTFMHGVMCNRIGRLIGNYVAERKLGWILNYDAGVVTKRGPDTTRGPDISFFSYARLPATAVVEKYADVAPELVFEVKSPSDRFSAMSLKANEYLEAGTLVVCIVDPETESVAVFIPDDIPRRMSNGDELTLPEVFPDFRVPVRHFFG